ncbi:hypothetical protein BGX21_003143 [Mortierella sp. AD011]|nr:hypothetical protein BGX20_008426 [Mortierella sp. AD010]KAF9400934.1 hypothetical protein BGX21_003143 [Mortierella sp. AD011]
MSPDEDPTTITDTEKSPPPLPSPPITQSSSNLNPTLQSALDTVVKPTETHLYAAKTRKNYNGHIERGKKYAAMAGPDMAGAFDSLTIMTPVVLRAFVSHKCNEEGFTYKTAEGIRSAFKRNEELLRLKGSDIQLNQTTDTGSRYFTITLSFRKTNQADASKANVYEIHPLPDEPHACCYTKLLAWLGWLEKNNHPLRPDDFLFPSLASDGRVKLKEPFSSSRIQTLLDQFTTDAGLLESRHGRYTAHCFRRGGAQHRFMFSKTKWSLKAVKWWGGWPEGEPVGTIMRYLMDEFVRYETGFGDMFSPTRSDSRHSVFMGELSNTDNVTQQSLAVSQEALRLSIINETEHSNSAKFSQLQNEIVFMRQEMNEKLAQLGSTITKQLQTIAQTLAQSTSTPTFAQQLAPVDTQTLDPPLPNTLQTQKQKKKNTQGIDGIPIAPRIPDITTWKDVIRQWDDGDLEKGLAIPLKLWTVRMRNTDSSRYSQRKLVATEYIRLGRSEANMKEVHGDAVELVSNLIASIREQKRIRKRSILGIDTSGKRRAEEEEEEEEVEGEGDEGVYEEEEDEDEEPLVPAAKRRR